MKKRIGINIILAFIICGLVNLVRLYVIIAILHNTRFFRGSYSDFLKDRFFSIFLITPLFFLIFVLLPYNWIILRYFEYKKKWLSLVQKPILLFLIILVGVLLVGTFENIWPPHWSGYLRYFIWFTLYSLLFAIPIHYLIDIPEQRKVEKRDKTH